MSGACFSFTGTRIYLGPSVIKKGLRFGMGFRNGLPIEIAAECAKCPAIFSLIVPVSQVTETRQLLSQKGSSPHQALELVEAYFKGGGEI